MAKDIDSKLDEVLDITSDIQIQTGEIVKSVPTDDKRSKNIETDYKYTRENLYGLVERGQDAIDGILDVCKETENPRAYEVAGQLIKTVGEKKLEGEDQQRIGKQENHLYVGSTSELQKFLKKNKNDS